MTLSNTTQTTEEPVAKKASAKTPKDRRASEALLQHILTTLEADKAEDIVQIDLKGKSEMADYMVICSGRSSRQVSALAEKLNDSIKSDLERTCKIEGKGAGDWVLLDTGDVIVHIFRPEVREFYQLEKMWQPGTSAPAAPEGTPSDYTPDA